MNGSQISGVSENFISPELMTVSNIVAALCLVLLTANLLYIALGFFFKVEKDGILFASGEKGSLKIRKKTRAERLNYLKNFKKGKCVLIYVICIPIYVVGLYADGNNLAKSILLSFDAVKDTVFLGYDFDSLQVLMNANRLFSVVVYYCFWLIALNAALFVCSIVWQSVYVFFKHIAFRCSAKDNLIIIGDCDDNAVLAQSTDKFDSVILDNLTKEGKYSLYERGIGYYSLKSDDNVVRKAWKIIEKHGKQRCVLVVNTLNDERNLKICEQLNGLLGEEKRKMDEVDILPDQKIDDRIKFFEKLRILVFGDPRFEAVYEDVASKSSGAMRYVNKYRQIAIDFIDKYPLAKFLNETQIDYKTSLIKPDVNINVFMIGFGKTNKQIFLTSVANNQFVEEKDGRVLVKQVDYFIFDKDMSSGEKRKTGKNLNHSYFRFKKETMRNDEAEYLPFPDLPANEHFAEEDINDEGFYGNLRRQATRSKNDANFAIIAFGSDLENVDLAKKLAEKRDEWGIKNFVIFVKIRKSGLIKSLGNIRDCYLIADEKDVVFNVDNLVNEKFYRMAKLRNAIYDLEYDIKHNNRAVEEADVQACKKRSFIKWYLQKTQIERESSLYCCLSLRSKLNMMGLDCVPLSSGGEALTEEEYLECYAADDKPDFKTYEGLNADGKRLVAYTLERKNSRRTTLAIQEHFRWNAFMLSKGIVPATKEEILSERVQKTDIFGEAVMTADGKRKIVCGNGKNYAARHHGNVTTFEGLEEFRKMLANSRQAKTEEGENFVYTENKTTEEEADVISYDYQIADDAFWLLEKFGMKIVRLNGDR